MITKRRARIAEINVVPYIDVMLVLLIIFMISAPLLTQGFALKLPRVDARPIPLPDPVVVSILKDQSYRISVGEAPNQIASAQSIAFRLKKITANNPDIAVLIEGDADIPYKTVLDLLSILRSSGIEDIGLVTAPPTTPEGLR